MIPAAPNPRRVAMRLGLDETAIRNLEAKGHLARLGLTEYEIRRRLYHAYLAAHEAPRPTRDLQGG